ncbi:AAA family ATPase [Geosporobacter ferrireducens]|uniref:Rad50/SbcC-type AAA domain-containing protein n=1 Tax=Geosporobacter ferrireducens TaxID=1424294 RepID=A0A1D8GPB5_9FIRM|nr:hypothetical protein [Geosporobacter ferrireducens]AOT72791.1 hypothetical protein Gferi_26480 [Geosporobacter ferrireducens]
MKKLRFKELIIISLVESSARKINLDADVNVFIGDNDTGKSSFIKSIYYALGATPPQVHPEWTQIMPITILKFAKDDIIYNMFRHGSYIVLFNENYEIINTFASIGNELSPYYEDFFDFKLKLTHSTSGELKTPLPSHYFLPFYIDQDVGWNKNWNSFDRLTEFKGWRKDLIEYHTGIKPNEYYILKAEKILMSELGKEITSELNALERVYLKAIEKNNSVLQVNIDVKQFEKDIEHLVIKLNEIKDIENKYRTKILDLYNEKAIIDHHIKLAESTIKELNKDYDFAEQLNETIECPTCGAMHPNTFAQRYIIAQDENRCYELLLQLNQEKGKIEAKISKENVELEEYSYKKNEIEAILNQKREEIKFNDYIENVGNSKLVDALKDELSILRNRIADIDGTIKNINKKMRKYVSGELQEEIEGYYFKLMKSFLFKLNVNKLKEETFKSISSSIKENGSDLSRALLAYTYSVLLVMEKYSSTYKCPIIIDSPLQNEQDDKNSVKILEFIRDHKPEYSQLILSCVDIHGVEFEGNIIELTDKYHFLSKDKFGEIFAEVQFIIDKAMKI